MSGTKVLKIDPYRQHDLQRAEGSGEEKGEWKHLFIRECSDEARRCVNLYRDRYATAVLCSVLSGSATKK